MAHNVSGVATKDALFLWLHLNDITLELLSRGAAESCTALTLGVGSG